MPESSTLSDGQPFERRLAHDFFVRIHMSLILVAVTASGVLASKGLLDLGMHSLRLRFPLAVMVSYGVFLVLIRIWIWYVMFRKRQQVARAAQNEAAGFALGMGAGKVRRRSGGGSSLDLGNFSSGSSGGSGGGGGFQGFGGGSSGGGGASSSWDSDVPLGAGPQPMIAPILPTGDSVSSMGSSGISSGGSPGSGFFSKLGFDFDIDGDGWVILLLLAALILAIIGAGGYLIYAAPHILPEAAWQAVLASTLTRVSKDEHHNWMAGVLRSTCIPFGIVLLFASALGWEAHHYCPDAPRLVDVILRCVLS